MGKNESKVDAEFKDLVPKSTPIVRIIAIVSVIIFIGLTVLVAIKGKNLDEDNNKYFVSITTEEFYDLYNGNEKFVLLLGRPGCSHCVAFQPIIKRVANDKEVYVYYLNTDTIVSETDWNLIWGLANQDGTPTLAVIENKKLIDSRSGEMEKDDLIYWFTEVGVL